MGKSQIRVPDHKSLDEKISQSLYQITIQITNHFNTNQIKPRCQSNVKKINELQFIY